MTHLTKWILLAVAISTSLFSNSVRERWIVNEDQREKWDEAIQRAGLTTEYVQEILGKYNLAELEFGKVGELSEQKAASLPSVPTIPEELLWKGEKVSLYSPKNPCIRNHLWITLNRPVRGFSEIEEGEAAALMGYVRQALQFLKEECGQPQAIIAQWNQPQKGHLEDRFVIEVIPTCMQANEWLHVVAHADAYNHICLRGKFSPTFPLPSLEEIERDREQWKNGFAAHPFVVNTESDVFEPWVQTQIFRQASRVQLLDHLYELFIQEGIAIERKVLIPVSDLEGREEKPVVAEMKSCPFCSERVVQNQKIFEGTYCSILYNYKPMTFGGNFIIVPKRHIRFAEKLMDEEIEEIYFLTKRLTQVLEEATGRKDIYMYIQNGSAVGQTVAHTTLHVALAPNPIRYLLFSINYESERCYSREEMVPHIEKIIRLLE